MEPEVKKLLEDTHNLAEENNKMLHKIRHNQKIGSFVTGVYWVIVISLGVGAFYFLQPYVDKMQHFFQTTSDTVSGFKNSFTK